MVIYMKYILCMLSLIFSLPAFADVDQHTALLEQKSNAVRSKIISEVGSEQIRQQNKLSIQLKIDSLRAKIGGEADLAKKMELEKQLKQLQQQKNNL